MRRFVLAGLLSVVPGLAYAQDPPAQEPPAGGGRGGRAADAEMRPFDRVITKDAKSDDGVFTVHRVKDRIYYVEALGKDDAVIEVTRLFTTDVPEFTGRTRVGARAFDASRSFVERAAAFPENVEIEATHTYNNPPLLPEKPMMPRLFDDRVGYFSIRQTDYSRNDHRSPQSRFITRWRLEKKDPNAALSEPVKSIGRARGRTHARVPTQHEGQLDVLRRQSADASPLPGRQAPIRAS